MAFSCGLDTSCITLDVEGGQLVATLVVSADDGNAAECRDNGLYVPGGLIVAGGLPPDPVDGQEAVYLASDDDGVIWTFKFRAGSASAYQWEAKGATPLYDHVTSLEGLEGSAPAGYVNIGGGTVGPKITVPLEGDYDIQLDAMIDGAEAGTSTAASLRIGGTAADFNDAIANYDTRYESVSRRVRKQAIPAGAQILVQYIKNSSSHAGFGHRGLTVWPVRVRG